MNLLITYKLNTTRLSAAPRQTSSCQYLVTTRTEPTFCVMLKDSECKAHKKNVRTWDWENLHTGVKFENHETLLMKNTNNLCI